MLSFFRRIFITDSVRSAAIHAERQQQRRDFYEDQDRAKAEERPNCGMCGGDGTCHICFGVGRVDERGDQAPCPQCNGSQRCISCGGSGKL